MSPSPGPDPGHERGDKAPSGEPPAADDGATVARRVVVGGRVQGVFFRDSCQTRAEAAGLAGWVRNRPDGQVEAWFEGSPTAVDRLVSWCREGPRGAAVADVEVSDEHPTGAGGFRVR